MKRSIRFFSFFVALSFSISMFAGCGSSGSATKDTSAVTTAKESTTVKEEPKVYPENGLPTDQEVTLKVGFAEQGNGRAWYDNCVASFTKKFPNVKFETQYSPTIDQVIKTKLAAGNDEDMFDLSAYNWRLVEKSGIMEPVEDLLQREVYDTPGMKLADALTPGIVGNLKYAADKHLYALPLTTYVGGLFFDVALFDQNGWNKNPKTWTEFLKLCDDIKAKGIAPIAYAGMYDYQMFAFRPKQYEIAAVNGNKDYMVKHRVYELPYYATPENIQAWNQISEMGKKGYIDPSSISINHTQSQMMAIQHKVAMVASGDWIGNEMKDSTPAEFQWGFMGVPFTDSADVSIHLMSGADQQYIIYSKKPELNKKWAKEFYLWLFNLESQQQLAEQGGAISIRKDFMNDAARAEKIGSVQKAVLEYINKNKAVLSADVNDIVLSHPSKAKAGKLIEDNNALMATGKKDPEAILKEADSILKEAIDAYKAGQ